MTDGSTIRQEFIDAQVELEKVGSRAKTVGNDYLYFLDLTKTYNPETGLNSDHPWTAIDLLRLAMGRDR